MIIEDDNFEESLTQTLIANGVREVRMSHFTFKKTEALKRTPVKTV
jgi:hypothetical protein